MQSAAAERYADSGESARALAENFDIKRIDPAFLTDPFQTYRALREHDPVHLMPDGSYFLSRYEDCLTVYREHDIWRSDKRVDFRPAFGDSLLYEHHTTSLVFNDPPYHSRVRNLLAPAFTPRALERACSRRSKLWSIGCSIVQQSVAASTSSMILPPQSRSSSSATC